MHANIRMNIIITLSMHWQHYIYILNKNLHFHYLLLLSQHHEKFISTIIIIRIAVSDHMYFAIPQL